MKLEYKVVAAMGEYLLELKVNALIGEGWQVQGGVSICTTGQGSSKYAQALVRPPAAKGGY
jgi:hypothetical protein